jgi:uncharacterized protein YjiS (DUF1127 family)
MVPKYRVCRPLAATAAERVPNRDFSGHLREVHRLGPGFLAVRQLDFPKGRNVRHDRLASGSVRLNKAADSSQILVTASQKTARTMETIMSTISNVRPGRDYASFTYAAIGRTLTRWWIAYMNWRLQRLAINRLGCMSDRELKDIGVSRSQIELAVKGQLVRHPIFSCYY